MTLQWTPLRHEHGSVAEGRVWRYEMNPATGRRRTWMLCSTDPARPVQHGSLEELREMADQWESEGK